MDLESTAKELRMLATREKLTASQLERAKALMVELKNLGMANPEIVELTGGRWSESTLKGYTKGIRAADPGSWQSTTALFSEMLSKNLTLADVRGAMAIIADLGAMGSSLGDVVGFMQDLKRQETDVGRLKQAIDINTQLEEIGTSPTELTGLMEDLKKNGTDVGQLKEAMDTKTQLEQIGSSPAEIVGFAKELEAEGIDVPAFASLSRDWQEAGLKPADARSSVDYKRQLEQAGLDVTILSHIAHAAGKLGNPAQVIEAVAKYGTLGELEGKLKTKQEELETLSAGIKSRSKEVTAASQKLEKVQKDMAGMEKALATYGRLEAIGFDEKALGELNEAAKKYGGPSDVLGAVNSFAALADIKASCERIQATVPKAVAALEKLRAEHTHLRSAIDTCQKLLDDHKFGLDAISTILSLAGRYGEPIEVLRAVEAYGKAEALEERIEQLKLEVVNIEGKVEQLKKTEGQYLARNKAILDQFEELNAKAIEVGRTVGIVEEQLKKDTSARDILNLLQNPVSAEYERHLPLVLVLVKSIGVWVTINKSKFTYCLLIDKNVQELVRYLGGS